MPGFALRQWTDQKLAGNRQQGLFLKMDQPTTDKCRIGFVDAVVDQEQVIDAVIDHTAQIAFDALCAAGEGAFAGKPVVISGADISRDADDIVLIRKLDDFASVIEIALGVPLVNIQRVWVEFHVATDASLAAVIGDWPRRLVEIVVGDGGVFIWVSDSGDVMGDGLVAQCVTKMAEYPITKLLYNEDEKSSLKNDRTIDTWKYILEEKMKIVKSMKQGGMDYYAYGNSIISINYPFKRMLDCPRCGDTHSADALKYKFRGFAFYADCSKPKCGYKGKMKARDINTKESSRIGLVHWDLLYMDIKYNSISGDHFYFYTVPPDLAASIRRADMDMVGTTTIDGTITIMDTDGITMATVGTR